MKTRAAVATVILVIATSDAAAAIRVTRDGESVHDAEICYYAAAGIDNPFVQQFASSVVTCSPTLPAGLWNVFARQDSRFISAHVVLVDSRKPIPDVELRLEPAATLTLPRSGAAYLTDTVSVFPGTLVPAERDLVPLLVENRKIVGVGSPVRLRAGESKRIAAFESRALVTWVSIAPADLQALRTARKPQPPAVVANKRVKPVNPLTGTVNLENALQIFRGLAVGDVTLDLSGVPWKRQQLRVTQTKNVVTTDEPLRLIPSSSLTLDWYAATNLTDLALHVIGDCKEASAKNTKTLTLALLRCKGIDRDNCAALAQKEIAPSERSGRVTFGDLDPASYVVEFRYRDLPPLRRTVMVKKFDETVERFPIEYATLFGKVTVGGQEPTAPIKIDFDWNGPQRAITDGHGEYFAVIEKPLAKDRVIRLRTCDGTIDASYIVDRDLAPNSRFDIDLPSNKLVVEAVDAKSGAPVAGARVRYGAFRSEEMSSTYYFRLAIEGDAPAHTGSDGRYTVENLSPEKTIHLCLEHDDYERTCPDTFRMTSTETKSVRVAMEPRNAFRGQIRAPQPIAGGQIYWYSDDGQQTESVPVKEDGSFRFNRGHGPNEVLAFVSANLPLLAIRQPSSDPLEIAFPALPVRSFEVTVSEDVHQTEAIVTIAIGDLIVPYPAFSQHLALHGSTLVLRNRGPLLVPDILEAAPISVLLGPPPSTVTPSRNDLFRLPQYRGVPRKPVTGPAVVFGR